MNEELARLLNKIKRGMGKVSYTARAAHSMDSSCLPLRQVEWQVLTCIQGKSSPVRRERPYCPTLELPSIISYPCIKHTMLIRKACAHLYQFTPGYFPLWIRIHQVPSHQPQLPSLHLGSIWPPASGVLSFNHHWLHTDFMPDPGSHWDDWQRSCPAIQQKRQAML